MLFAAAGVIDLAQEFTQSGGAVGNLVDRINHGYVVDFIDVYYGDWHWPAFNLADSAITCGVILLILDGLFFSSSAKTSVED